MRVYYAAGDCSVALARLPCGSSWSSTGPVRHVNTALMEGVAAQPDDDRKKLFQTRFEVLAELSESERKSLMGTHMAIVMEKGMDMMQTEMRLTEAVVPQLAPPVRQMVQTMMESMRTGGMH